MMNETNANIIVKEEDDKGGADTASTRSLLFVLENYRTRIPGYSLQENLAMGNHPLILAYQQS